MSNVKDIFGSSSDSDESFKGFSITEMTKMKNLLWQTVTEAVWNWDFLRAGPHRSTSMASEGSDRALPQIDMDPTPQMREISSPDANDISTKFVRLENLV